MVTNLLILILVAFITFLLILLLINFVNKIFGNKYLSSIKENIEIIKTIFVLIIALFSFYFIDLQRQLLSRSNFEFEILKTFYKDALERDTEKRLFVCQTITLYRQNFVIPNSPLDNCLISLNQTILSNNDVKMMLAAPEYRSLVKKLYEDKSPLISKVIKTNEEIFGPLEGLNEEQLTKWRDNNLIEIDLPFPIPLSWDKDYARRIQVHKKAAKYFLVVFNEIKRRGLEKEITSYGGSYGHRKTFIPRRLSSHNYGIAIDLNVEENQMGTKGNMNAEIVAIFKQNGFAWGGDWKSIPDPMHFELLPTTVSEGQYVIN